MKIAILTLPLHLNYGGILQCYALQTVLERMGNEVNVLNNNCGHVRRLTRIRLFVARLIKTLLRKESKFYGCKTEWEVISQNTQRFVERYIHNYHIKDFATLKEGEFDAIVVGSDQIWRTKYYGNISNAYLKFATEWHSLKRIAYAASFGTDEWEYTQAETKECAQLAKLFDAISVREKSGINLCNKYLGVEATQVLDPTLMLSKDDYLNVINNANNVEGHDGGLYYYFLDETEEKLDFLQKIAKKNGVEPFKVHYRNVDKNITFEQKIQRPVEQWIAGFRDASFVVTDSFHGCVFSIIFNKPFIAIGNRSRGLSRFNSLLELFGLQNRLIDENAIVDVQEMGPIDFDAVNEKLTILQNHSKRFLQNVIA